MLKKLTFGGPYIKGIRKNIHMLVFAFINYGLAEHIEIFFLTNYSCGGGVLDPSKYLHMYIFLNATDVRSSTVSSKVMFFNFFSSFLCSTVV